MCNGVGGAWRINKKGVKMIGDNLRSLSLDFDLVQVLAYFSRVVFGSFVIVKGCKI